MSVRATANLWIYLVYLFTSLTWFLMWFQLKFFNGNTVIKKLCFLAISGYKDLCTPQPGLSRGKFAPALVLPSSSGSSPALGNPSVKTRTSSASQRSKRVQQSRALQSGNYSNVFLPFAFSMLVFALKHFFVLFTCDWCSMWIKFAYYTLTFFLFLILSCFPLPVQALLQVL